MATFKAANWDFNDVSEATCQELRQKPVIENLKIRRKAYKNKNTTETITKSNEKNYMKIRHKNENKNNNKQLRNKNEIKPRLMINRKIKNHETRIKSKEKLKKVLEIPKDKKKVQQKKKPNLTLREKMLNRLKSAQFRFLNEQMYTITGKKAQEIFKKDPESFKSYHKGYRQQVNQWPFNPLDKIITSIRKMPKSHIIADFGCGDAKLAKSVTQVVHSFDLIAINDSVTTCDMANVPLSDHSVDCVVFCLSLMGTNLNDFVLEANRILKIGGILKIAEVESRIENINEFVKNLQRFNFQKISMDFSHNLFYFIDFKKEANVRNRKKLPIINLKPCLYKKR